MTRAMAIERGSTWNKWDFHVHTPYSLLNNGFGINILNENPDSLDTYVQKLFKKAIESEIVAIGITDYFSVDGYKKLRQDYLSNSSKMEELFPEKDIREKISKIFVFPNVEFRLENFVGEGNHAVNYHVIFSDAISVTDIEENFLHRLEFVYNHAQTLPITQANIKKAGQEFKKHNFDKRHDLIVGLEKITVDYKNIVDILSTTDIFADNYMISIPVDEDLSKINWEGRDYVTRKNLYQQCNLLMTSNSCTRSWALAKGNEVKFISEFGALKPCIWGSDAHDYESMFAPTNNKYCWIKAEPTFEGLRQILYEPESRVRIQSDYPSNKDAHQIIDHITFHSDQFISSPIYFNESLNVIIGGKSTGKSLLLRHIAKNIDSQQVLHREEAIFGKNNSPIDVEATVEWKDGASGDRKIIYIPQSWLNRIVDEFQGNSQLNLMLQDILLQQSTIKSANDSLKNNLSQILTEMKHIILDYVNVKEKASKLEDILKEHGRSIAFNATIGALEKKIEEMSYAAGITDDVLKMYNDLEKRLSEQSAAFERVKNEEASIEFQTDPFVYIPGITTVKSEDEYTYSLDKVPITKELFEDAISNMNEAVSRIWKDFVTKIHSTINETKTKSATEISKINEQLSPLKERISANEALKKIDAQLQTEKARQKNAKEIEQEKSDNLNTMKDLKRKALVLRTRIDEEYDKYKKVISGVNLPGSSLVFDAEIAYKKHDFFDAVASLFNNRTFRSFKEKYHYDLSDKDDFQIDDGLFSSIWAAMEDGTLGFKSGNNLQSALEWLFYDWLYVHFLVRSDNDEISNMSPGKKAIVLLELIVNLEKSNCPILIDQPEDDLDNRSIYSDLVQYLRKKKTERQIIVVSHNANIVAGADAEEVIIANQEGDEAKNHSKRFEYRCGAIENINPVYDENNTPIKGVLYQKGIQQQICDILEGGIEAFEMRRNKYHAER